METKFVDAFEGVVSLKANIVKSKNALASVGVQSEKTTVKNGETQSEVGVDVSLQTDELLLEKSTFGSNGDATYNWHTLNDFLLRTEPLILRTLADNRRTFRVFAAYEAAALADERDANVVIEHSLKSTQSWPDGAQAIALAWNSSGTTIGVACGRTVHDDWCTHHGFVMTWNIDRTRLNSNQADHVYEIGSCCTCLAFHPHLPHLFASCTYTGDVSVWSLLEEGNAVASASSGDQSAINCMAWVPPASPTEPFSLATGGADGNIIIWSLPSKGRTLAAMKAFQMRVVNLPRSLRGKLSGETKLTGTMALSFARPPLASRFMVGTETGGVFQCSLDTTASIGSQLTIGGRSGGLSCYDPVVLAQKAHNGPVYKVSFHPREQATIGSCGADGVVRVGTAFHPLPALEIDADAGSLYDLSWSPLRPCVFACATGSGRLLVFDLTQASDRPVLKIDTANEQVSLLAVAFNPRYSNVVATGDTAGYVKIWNLGEAFASVQGGEQQTMEELVEATGAAGGSSS